MGYGTVLSVVNEHTASTVAARYAMAMAAEGQSALVLYAAQAEGTDEAPLRHTDRHLDHLFCAAVERGIAVRRITEIGAVAELLPKRVSAETADIVFYPLAPGEQYGATLQQQTVHKLLRTVAVDLAIMRIMHMGRLHPRHILVPLGSSISDLAARAAFLVSLARSFHAQITLYHRGNIARSALPDDYLALRNELQHHQVSVLERSGSGHIARAIALEAVSHHNDLIILGASERGGLRRLFFGNPAGDVMRHPPCNSLLFRPGRQIP